MYHPCRTVLQDVLEGESFHSSLSIFTSMLLTISSLIIVTRLRSTIKKIKVVYFQSMQNAHISVSDTTSALTPAPFTTSQVILTKQEHIQLKQQANQWRAMWKAACDREQKALAKNSELISRHKAATAELNAQIAELKSELAHMKYLLFGRKSEKTSSSSGKSGNTTRPPSNRKQPFPLDRRL